MKKRLAILAAVPAISLLSIGAAWSQFGGNERFERIGSGEAFLPRPPEQQAASDKIEEIASQLREGGDENKKAYLTAKLKEAVDAGFEEDMKSREAELSKLEERLNKLRAQLERRKKAKSEIVQLEVKVLVNEAEGLGFSPAPLQGFGKSKRRVRVRSENRSFLAPTTSVMPADESSRPKKTTARSSDFASPPAAGPVPAAEPVKPSNSDTLPPTLGPAPAGAVATPPNT